MQHEITALEKWKRVTNVKGYGYFYQKYDCVDEIALLSFNGF